MCLDLRMCFALKKVYGCVAGQRDILTALGISRDDDGHNDDHDDDDDINTEHSLIYIY